MDKFKEGDRCRIKYFSGVVDGIIFDTLPSHVGRIVFIKAPRVPFGFTLKPSGGKKDILAYLVSGPELASFAAIEEVLERVDDEGWKKTQWSELNIWKPTSVRSK